MKLEMRFGQPGWSILAAAAGAVVMFCAAQGVVAGTIVGSKHDFSAQTWSGNQICVLCHAPHNTTSTSLLWNHATTSATYQLYSSTTLNATLAQPAAGSVSKLCLSCHDGTVAIDSFGGATGTTNATGGALLGTDLRNDHPIGFTYDAALVTADGGLKAITTNVTIGSGTQTKTGPISSLLLYGGQVECSSCHDVHNTFTAAPGKLNKIRTQGSDLCLACHNK